MASLIALSFHPLLSSEERNRLTSRATAALQVRDGSRPSRTTTNDGVVLSTYEASTGAAIPLTRSGLQPADPDAPPGGCLEIDEGVTLRTDRLGLKHAYQYEAADWCAVSTSAPILGAVSKRPLDERSWLWFGLTGSLVSERSLLDGVERIRGATTVRLARGSLRRVQLAPRAGREDLNGVDAVRMSVGQLLRSHGDAALELSGGLDSRVILAAIPPDERAGRSAITIGDPGDPDVEIARRIASRWQLDHQVIPPWRVTASIANDYEAVQAAALARDFCADGLAGAIHEHVDDQVPTAARFTGLNGEYIRGFFYPGTPPIGGVTRGNVERLVKWRLLTNHRVGDGVLHDSRVAEAVDSFTDYVHDRLLTTGMPSLRAATDEYYLHERVVGWAGPTYSRSATRYAVLAPFLQPEFLNWVAQVPVSVRAGSRALAGCLIALDDELGSLPLADGLTPSQLVSGSPMGYASRGTHKTGKVVRKVRQRAQRSRRPPSSTAGPLEATLRAFADQDPRSVIAQAPFISPHFLDSWAPKRDRLDATTLGYLLNLVGILTFLAQVDRQADRSVN